MKRKAEKETKERERGEIWGLRKGRGEGWGSEGAEKI
jgi:hypothetical protein